MAINLEFIITIAVTASVQCVTNAITTILLYKFVLKNFGITPPGKTPKEPVL